MWLKIGRGLFAALRIALGSALTFVGYALVTRDVAVMNRMAQWATDPPFGLTWWGSILLALGAATVLQALPSPWRGERSGAAPPRPEPRPTRTLDAASRAGTSVASEALVRPPLIRVTPMPERRTVSADDGGRRQPVEHGPAADRAGASGPLGPPSGPSFRSRPKPRSGYRNLQVLREPLNRRP